MKETAKGIGFFFFLAMIVGMSSASAEQESGALTKALGGGDKIVVSTMPEGVLISTAGAIGSPAYHRHLVRPGAMTSYLIRLLNPEAQSVSVELEISAPPEGWSAKLEKTSLNLEPAQPTYIRLELMPSSKLPKGKIASVTVAAKPSSGPSGQITVEAETTDKHKIYYISIDSFSPEYLKLNAAGNGLGKEGDWLMPNLHALLKESSFYPNHRTHLIAATDMNHAAYLNGAYPGRSGIYSVNVFLFGFDQAGNPIIKATSLDLMYYGREGKPVPTIFNVVKDPVYGGNPAAFTAYISGKDWVPEHYRNPVFGLDRIATVKDYPDYVTPVSRQPVKNEAVKQILAVQFGKFRDSDYFLWEDQYTVEQAMQVINNEDPEVCYILLGGVDAAGHTFGAGYDLDEWETKGTPEDLSDDVSKINWRANRLGIIQTVKGADEQLGRLIAFLKERGAYEDSYLVVESDHNMETNFFQGPKLQQIVESAGYSPKTDYFLFTISQIGALFLRPGAGDPEIIPSLEKALEEYRLKNPLTSELECPMIILNREEMKTGIDRVTGEQVTLPMELYSEYYIEHRKAGDLLWPDLILLSKKYYQFPLMGVGLASVGVGKLDLPLPKINVFVGGHGGPSTQPALLMIRGPGIAAQELGDRTYSSDVAPTLYFLEGYQTPESVQGKKLPKVH